MRIIIDTHIFLWALSNPKRLSPEQRALLESTANIIYVSSISIAEIMIKTSLGKLQFDGNPLKAAQQTGFEFLSFSAEAAFALGELPYHHKDPFDRMLIAQSIESDYVIMTDDNQFKMYACKLI